MLEIHNTKNVAVAFNSADNIQDISADIAEIRVDQFSSFNSDEVCKQLKQFSHIPNIVTIRKKAEDCKSKWQGNEQDRLNLFKDILNRVDSINAIDIEFNAKDILNEVIDAIRQHNKTAIVSFHDFEKTPSLDELVKIIDQAKKYGADIVKIATQVNSDEDIQTLKLLTKVHKEKNLIIIGMGEKGMQTRVELPLLGSLFTFACSEKYCSAPGQLNYQQTKEKINQLRENAKLRAGWEQSIEAMPSHTDKAFDTDWLNADLLRA